MNRLDVRLLALVERFESHGLQAATASGVANGVTVEDDAVAVRIIAESEGDVEALRQAVEVAGGSVQSVFESNVYASLPVASLGAFARFIPLYRMDLQEPVASPMAVPGEEQGADAVSTPAVPAAAEAASGTGSGATPTAGKSGR